MRRRTLRRTRRPRCGWRCCRRWENLRSRGRIIGSGSPRRRMGWRWSGSGIGRGTRCRGADWCRCGFNGTGGSAMARPISPEPRVRDAHAELHARLENAPAEHAEALLAAYEVLQGLHDRGVPDLMRGALGSSDKLLEIALDA